MNDPDEQEMMKIAIASGKGGTGKTTIAANLAVTAAQDQRQGSVWLLDCDVEAPNDALFLHPSLSEEKISSRLMPVFDLETCSGCGTCAQVCAYNAIAVVNGKALFFHELCHSCGSCALNCPQAAIREEPEVVGRLQRGRAGRLRFAQGTLEIGYSSPVPVIRDLKKWALEDVPEDSTIFLDASPGCTCPVAETLRDVDFALLVTEPTPFGLHDLKLVAELAQQEMKLPCGVVINKSGKNDAIITDFCEEKGIPVLARLPLSREIAETYAVGKLLVDEKPQYAQTFRDLYEKIRSSLKEAE